MQSYPDLIEGLSFDLFLQQTVGAGLASSYLGEDQLSECYEEYRSVDFYDLSVASSVSETATVLPEHTACSAKAIVIDKIEEGYLVGFANPFDDKAVARIESALNDYIKPVMVNEKLLRRIHRVMYRKVHAVQNYANNIKPDKFASLNVELIDSKEKYNIPGLVNLIIQDAFDIQASDIHFEKNKVGLRVRIRVDGSLKEYDVNNTIIGDNIIRYLKLLSDVDVTQDKLPADGKKVTLVFNGAEVNLRFSFMPTYYGQSVVIRILGDASTYVLSNKIKHHEYLSSIQSYLKRSYGMFVISGPTGSGKTTTLYSALEEVNDENKKIISLEDPVEARIPGLNQVQINEAAGYSFGQAVRASLRQDPDIIMIGEIRDEDTAVMAVRAAITGHLVLASIHTRGVVEIPIRLLNLGLDPYLLASALRLNVSQRLVKLICSNCKSEEELSEYHVDFIKDKFGVNSGDDHIFYYGKGCELCQFTGCFERTAVFELLHLSAEMTCALSSGDIAGYMTLANKEIQGKTILDRAYELALSGEIAIDEVLKLEAD